MPLNAQRLLAFLAFQSHPMHRAYIAGQLWIDASQEHAFSCLRTTLWRMHRLPATLVEATRTHLALSPVMVVDVQELTTCAERVFGREAPPDREEVERLVRGGEILPDWYDDWIIEERERLHQLRLLALEETADNLLRTGRYAEAATSALAAVTTEPLRESARRLLIRSHFCSGNIAEAFRQYAVFRARLARDLGLEPSRQMEDLVESWRDVT